MHLSHPSFSQARLLQEVRWQRWDWRSTCDGTPNARKGPWVSGFGKTTEVGFEVMHCKVIACVENLFSFDRQLGSGCSHCRAIITQYHLRQPKAPHPPELYRLWTLIELTWLRMVAAHVTSGHFHATLGHQPTRNHIIKIYGGQLPATTRKVRNISFFCELNCLVFSLLESLKSI